MWTTDVPFQKNENGFISGQILKVTLKRLKQSCWDSQNINFYPTKMLRRKSKNGTRQLATSSQVLIGAVYDNNKLFGCEQGRKACEYRECTKKGKKWRISNMRSQKSSSRCKVLHVATPLVSGPLSWTVRPKIDWVVQRGILSCLKWNSLSFL